MSADGYAVVRKSTLAYLLDRARLEGELRDVPEEVARDLGTVLPGISAPPGEDRIAAAGPLLSLRDHVELLAGDPDLDLPQRGQAAEFWRTVTGITLTILRNEAEAVRRVMAER